MPKPAQSAPFGARIEYLLAIHHWTRVSGFAPNYPELAALLNVTSKHAIGEMLGILETLGFVEREHGIPRAVWLTPAGLAKVDEVHRAIAA